MKHLKKYYYNYYYKKEHREYLVGSLAESVLNRCLCIFRLEKHFSPSPGKGTEFPQEGKARAQGHQ